RPATGSGTGPHRRGGRPAGAGERRLPRPGAPGVSRPGGSGAATVRRDRRHPAAGRGRGARRRECREAGGAVSVWDPVVGQTVVPMLQRTVADAAAALAGEEDAGTAMTHAWLFTGPPGSGRSVVARAFAAALQCPYGGCGQCGDCADVRSGAHPDVANLVTDGLSIKI